MKTLLFFIVFAVSAIFSTPESLFGQTNHQKKQLKLLEGEISLSEILIKRMDRNYEFQKNKTIQKLNQQLVQLQRQANPNRARTEADLLSSIAKIAEVNAKIDSIKLSSDAQIEHEKLELAAMQITRKEMISSWYDTKLEIPREMKSVQKKRRQNSNVIRREELVLSKIETNLETVAPNGNPIGYKIILDNKYSLSTTFYLHPTDGGEKKAIAISPRTKEAHYLLPGVYIVETYTNGHQDGPPRRLTIDGQVHNYETETCFGFVSKSR